MTFSPYTSTYLGPLGLVYSAVLKTGKPISSIGLSLDSNSRTFTIYTGDFGNEGKHFVKLTAYSTEEDKTHDTEEFIITIERPVN